MANILGIGISALQSAQVGLLVTQHNIANANTPGYHRQDIVQSALLPQKTGQGFVGSGVGVNSVDRLYNRFLEQQMMRVNTQSQYLSTYHTQIKQIDDFLADADAGLAPAMQEFFKGVQDLAANPASVPARQSVLSTSSAFVGQAKALQERFDEIRQGVNVQLEDAITRINSYSKQIAALNDQIKVAAASSSNNQLPNDLMDQRDQLISELNGLIQVSTVAGPNNSVDVYVGKGQPLVVNVHSYQMAVLQSSEDPDNLSVGYIASGATAPTEIPDDLLNGGVVGGLFEFRSKTLDPAQNALGRVTVGLVETFNAQHRIGVDLNGNTGINFFNTFTGATAPVVAGNTSNTGSGAFTATYGDVGALTSSNYRIAFDGTNYSVTDLNTNSTTSGLTAATVLTAVPGLNLTLSGSPAAGDSFLAMPTRYAAGDLGVAVQNTSQLAAALPVTTSTGINNTGTGVIDAGGVTSGATLPTAPVTMTYNSTTQVFDLTSADPAFNGISVPSSGTYTAGSTMNVNGITFAISGAPVNGDVFNLNLNYGASFSGDADNRNALLLGDLVSTPTLVNNASGKPTASYQSAYSQLISFVGNKTNEVEVRSRAQDTLLEQVTREQQSFSGVNLDEEAANLLKYQYAYQAAAKSIETAQKVLDLLTSLG